MVVRMRFRVAVDVTYRHGKRTWCSLYFNPRFLSDIDSLSEKKFFCKGNEKVIDFFVILWNNINIDEHCAVYENINERR